jgi:hypothetical protein
LQLPSRPPRLCTRCCRLKASEPIPFPGADSIFSRHCGAIPGRFAVSLAVIPANETPRSLLRPEPHEFQTLVLRAQKLRPPRGASEARRAPKTPYHEFCLYERKTPKNRSRRFRGKIAPEDAPSCAAITGRPSVSQLSNPRLSMSNPSAHGPRQFLIILDLIVNLRADPDVETLAEKDARAGDPVVLPQGRLNFCAILLGR